MKASVLAIINEINEHLPLADQIGRSPDALVREIAALWEVIGPDKRREFLAAQAEEEKRRVAAEAEEAAVQSARRWWLHAHRDTPNYQPDWSDVEYLRWLAKTRRDWGLPPRADLENLPEPKPVHCIRTYKNPLLGFNNADIAQFEKENNR